MNNSKPNFVIIYPDSMGANSLGCYGNSYAKTPCMDKLAEEGMMFTQATSCNPVCMPSRASLHTGRYVGGHNVRNNCTEELSGTYPSIAQSLRADGYRLAYYGKTHSLIQEEWDDVFDLYPDYNRYLKGRRINVKYPEKPSSEVLCAGISKIPEEDFSENILGNLGESFIYEMANSEEPFLLFMSHEAPHSPWVIPEGREELYESFDVVLPEVPEEHLDGRAEEQTSYLKKRGSMATDDKLRHAIKTYMTLLKIVDENVGKLVDALKETGQLDNTVIVIMSDHGDNLGNHRSMGKGVSLDENLVHIPMVFYAPKKWRAGKNAALTQNIDLYPTILELAGITPPPGIQGMSLKSLLENQCGELRDYAFSEEHSDGYECRFSARDARYKLVFCEYGNEELYDLENDPHEWNNLIACDELQDKITELKNAMLRWRFHCIDRKVPESDNWITRFMKPDSAIY